MRTKASIMACVLAFTNLCAGATAVTAGKGWDEVMKLPKYIEVILELKDGLKYKGRVSDVTPYSLMLWGREEAVEFQAEDIVKITKTGTSTGKMAIYGAGAGGIVGFIVGGKALKEGDDADDIAKKMGIPIVGGAAVGLIVGFFKGLFTNDKRTIYRKK